MVCVTRKYRRRENMKNYMRSNLLSTKTLSDIDIWEMSLDNRSDTFIKHNE